MANILKRSISVVLAFVMAVSCIVFVNVATASAYVPETIYKFYANESDAEANGDSIDDNAVDIFPNAKTNTQAFTSGTYEVEGKEYTLAKASGNMTSLNIVVPDGVVDASFSIVLQSTSTSTRTLSLSKDGVAAGANQSVNKANVVNYTGLSSGTYVFKATNNVKYALITLKVPPVYSISGIVKDNKGVPVKCATVYVDGELEEESYQTRTEGNGDYTIPVPYGKYTVRVTAMYCYEKSKTVNVEKDVTQDFILSRYGERDGVYKFYGRAENAEANYDNIDDNATDVFTNATVGSDTTVITDGPFTVAGSTYNLSYYGGGQMSYTIEVPAPAKSAKLYMVLRPIKNYDATLSLSKDGTVVDNKKSLSKNTTGIIEYTDLTYGTYTLTSNHTFYPMLLILTTSPVHTVSGTVTDTTGEPIKCAAIVTSGGLETRTDDEGNYSVKVPEGSNTVDVTALGYTSGSETFSLTEDLSSLDFTLRKDRNNVYKFYGQSKSAEANYDSIDDNATDIFTDASTSTDSTVVSGGPFNVGGSSYELTCYGTGRLSYTIEVPEGVANANLYMAFKNTAYDVTLNLSKDGTAIDSSKKIKSSEVGIVTYTGLSEGTYQVSSAHTFYPMVFILATSPVYTVSGTVMDTAGNPLKSSYVYINDRTLITDEDGQYSIDVGVDTKITSIQATALGYKDANDKVSISGETVHDIVLHKNRNTIHKFYGNADDAKANYDSISDNATDIFTNLSTSTNTVTGETFNVGGSAYVLSHKGAANKAIEIAVPEGVEDAELYMVLNSGTRNITFTLNREGNVVGSTKTLSANSSDVFTYTGLSGGTYTLISNYSVYPMVMILTTSLVYTISGTVTNKSGEPVKCANVYVGNDIRLRTDGDGAYSTDIAEGAKINSIKATALGCADKNESVSISNEATHDIVLDNGEKDIVYKFFANSNDAESNYDKMSNNNTDVFTNALTGSNSIKNFGAGNFDIEGSTFKLYYVSGGLNTLNIVIPEGVTDADFYMIGKATTTSATTKLTLSKDGDVVDDTKSMVGSQVSTVEYDGLSQGTYTLKGNKSYRYALLAIAATQEELPVITEENVTKGVTAMDNGLVSDIAEDSPFAEMVGELDSTDKIFTLVGVINGQHGDSTFMKKINQVGFVLYDADVVDSLGEDAKSMNPQDLKSNYSDTDFAGVTIKTNTVYKNFYDANQYDETLDSANKYTGETSLEESDEKSYFAYVVALGQGKRYYAYPFTLYSGTNINSYDETVTGKIEMSNN